MKAAPDTNISIFEADWKTILFAMIIAITWFFADYFFVRAYTDKGNLIAITTITILFPAFSTLLKFLITRELPNIYQVAGYLLAIGAIILFTKGSQSPNITP